MAGNFDSMGIKNGASVRLTGLGTVTPIAVSGEITDVSGKKLRVCVAEGESVIVSSGEVSQPVAVRYAWASNPEGANLVNGEGLPASLFRTDDWKVSTQK